MKEPLLSTEAAAHHLGVSPRTLEHWLERYEQNLDAVRTMFDESFVRAWRLYLAGSIKAFEHGSLQLFQVVFARSGMNEIPRTREHMYPAGG